MDEKISAIVIKSIDYLEYDKMVWLYSLQHGRISAVAKGVKKNGAKLKNAVEQFAFGSYSLSSGNGKTRFVISGCDQIENFYSLRLDLDKYYVACIVLDTLSQLEIEGQSNPQVFLLTLKTLQQLTETDVSPKLLLVKFLLDYLSYSGYKLNFDQCGVCHSSNFTRLYIDLVAGSTACVACRSSSSFEIAPPVLAVLNTLSDMPLAKVKVCKYKEEYLTNALVLLNQYITHTLGKIKSFSQMLEL